MGDVVGDLVRNAIRRHKDAEQQRELAQQLAERSYREESLPPANHLFSDTSSPTSEGEEHSDSPEHGTPDRETPSRRRRRSPSMDLNTPEERQQKYACFTEAACDRFALRGSRRSLVMGFAKGDYHEKMITLMAFLQRRETEQASSEIQAYIGSAAFKAHAATLFYTALVAPHNRAYVAGLATFIEQDMVRNYPLYKVNKIIVEDEEARATLNTQMRTKLAAMRNAIKEKLDTAVEQGHCMNQLMLDIMPKNIEVRVEHRQRWAWILGIYRAYKEENPNNTSNFWKHLDKTLFETELKLAEEVPAKDQREEIRPEIFKAALERHEKDYPNQIPPPEKVDTPSWQIMLERNLDKFHRP